MSALIKPQEIHYILSNNNTLLNELKKLKEAFDTL